LTGKVDWQVTATTIYCDAVDDEVTILVYKDWAVKCTGYDKYAKSSDNSLRIFRKSRRPIRAFGCKGSECSRMVEYKDRLMAEENKKGLSGQNST